MGRGSGDQAPTPAGWAGAATLREARGPAQEADRTAATDTTSIAARLDELRDLAGAQTEQSRRELDYAFHRLLPAGDLGYRARETWADIQRQAPEASLVATSAAWVERGYRVPAHVTPISVTDKDGAVSLLYDIGDVVPPNTRKPPRADDPTEVFLGQVADVADAYGLTVYRAVPRGGTDPEQAALRRAVNRALLQRPDSPAVLARASYTDALGRRRERAFVATHKDLAPEVEAQAVTMRLVRHMLNEELRERREASPDLRAALAEVGDDGAVALDWHGAAMPEYVAAAAARRDRQALVLDGADERQFWWQWTRDVVTRETLAAAVADAVCRENGVRTADGPLAQLVALRGGGQARHVLDRCGPQIAGMVERLSRKLRGEDLFA